MNKKYIIYTPSFDINSGGAIILHYLCHLLNSMDYDAYLWYERKAVWNTKRPLFSIYRFYRYYKKYFSSSFLTNPSFNTPIAKSNDLEDSIVIYPEIVDGNPLNAKKVVRWLLHKPGFHTGRINFTKDELIFAYSKECEGSGITINKEQILTIKYIMRDIYYNKNNKIRNNICYSIRKGVNKTFIHSKDAICIDGLSHAEISDIFNKSHTFISYDPYSYYSTYASLCGCNSIIVPDTNISKEQWHPDIRDRYGLAYGIDDIDYGIETRSKMMEYLDEQDKLNLLSIKNFINETKKNFY